MAFLDSIMDVLTRAADSPGVAGKVIRGAENLGDLARYGVTAGEKGRMTHAGEIPGQPSAMLADGRENPEAIRYASGYLAQKSGHLPGWANALGNNFALEDFGRSPQQSAAIKMAGQRGAEMATGMKGSPFMAALAALLKPGISSGQ